MTPKSRRTYTIQKKARIPGQGKPKDISLKMMFRNNDSFAEVFNRNVTKDNPIDPEALCEMDTDEISMLQIQKGRRAALEQFRDVVKGLGRESVLVILGVENQMLVNYMMPYRVLELEMINYGRQISVIREQHKTEQENPKTKRKLCPSEYVGNFYKEDRIKPVLCLVLYYGKEEWDGPFSMSDMYVDSPWSKLAFHHPMYLLDVRHMEEKELEEYSDNLRPFFGFLKYENTDLLEGFIEKNQEQFENLPNQTVEALAELADSIELKIIQKECKTEKGGVNMCKGIQMMIKKGEERGIRIGEERGEKRGEKRGERTKAMEIAKNMIYANEYGEKIVLYTGLRRPAVKQLARKLDRTVIWTNKIKKQ